METSEGTVDDVTYIRNFYDIRPGVPKKPSSACTSACAFACWAGVSFVSGRCPRYVSSVIAGP
jgi:hypothetical protein